MSRQPDRNTPVGTYLVCVDARGTNHQLEQGQHYKVAGFVYPALWSRPGLPECAVLLEDIDFDCGWFLCRFELTEDWDE